jgi:hypothetical protein
MQEMGLFEPGPNGIQRVTADAGLAAANAFRASIGPEMEAMFVSAVDEARVDRATLAALHPIVPSRVPDPSDERAAYENTLFAAGQQAQVTDRSRRASLSLILDVASRYGERPTPESVRWALFDPPAVDLPDDLEAQRLLWEAYQCQDLFQVAAAALLAWAISIMAEAEEGRTLAEIQGAVEDRLGGSEEATSDQTWGRLRDGREGVGRRAADRGAPSPRGGARRPEGLSAEGAADQWAGAIHRDRAALV